MLRSNILKLFQVVQPVLLNSQNDCFLMNLFFRTVRNYHGGRVADNAGKVVIFCASKKGGVTLF